MSAEAPVRPLGLALAALAAGAGGPAALYAAWPAVPAPVLALPTLAVAGAFLFWLRRVVKAPRTGREE